MGKIINIFEKTAQLLKDNGLTLDALNSDMMEEINEQIELTNQNENKKSALTYEIFNSLDDIFGVYPHPEGELMYDGKNMALYSYEMQEFVPIDAVYAPLERLFKLTANKEDVDMLVEIVTDWLNSAMTIKPTLYEQDEPIDTQGGQIIRGDDDFSDEELEKRRTYDDFSDEEKAEIDQEYVDTTPFTNIEIQILQILHKQLTKEELYELSNQTPEGYGMVGKKFWNIMKLFGVQHKNDVEEDTRVSKYAKWAFDNWTEAGDYSNIEHPIKVPLKWYQVDREESGSQIEYKDGTTEVLGFDDEDAGDRADYDFYSWGGEMETNDYGDYEQYDSEITQTNFLRMDEGLKEQQELDNRTKALISIGGIQRDKVTTPKFIKNIFKSSGHEAKSSGMEPEDGEEWNTFYTPGTNIDLNADVQRIRDRIRFEEYGEMFQQGIEGRGFAFEGMLAGLFNGEPMEAGGKEDIKVGNDYYSIKQSNPGDAWDTGSLQTGYNFAKENMLNDGFSEEEIPPTPVDLMVAGDDYIHYKAQMLTESFKATNGQPLKWIFAHVLDAKHIEYDVLDSEELISALLSSDCSKGTASQACAVGQSRKSDTGLRIKSRFVLGDPKMITFPTVSEEDIHSIIYDPEGDRVEDKIRRIFRDPTKVSQYTVDYIKNNPNEFLDAVNREIPNLTTEEKKLAYDLLLEETDIFGQGLMDPINPEEFEGTEEEWDELVRDVEDEDFVVEPEYDYEGGKTNPETGFVAPSAEVTDNICKVKGFCEAQGPITFGQLKALVEEATKKRISSDIGRGVFKSLWRIVPFFIPQVLLASVGVTVTRAFNKVITPALKDTQGYKSWWGKVVLKAMDIAEGDYIPDVALGDDPLSKIFFISDGLLQMIRDKYKLKFARYVADVATAQPDNEPVPEWFVENLLRDYLNQKFLLDPPLPIKKGVTEDKEQIEESKNPFGFLSDDWKEEILNHEKNLSANEVKYKKLADNFEGMNVTIPVDIDDGEEPVIGTTDITFTLIRPYIFQGLRGDFFDRELPESDDGSPIVIRYDLVFRGVEPGSLLEELLEEEPIEYLIKLLMGGGYDINESIMKKYFKLYGITIGRLGTIIDEQDDSYDTTGFKENINEHKEGSKQNISKLRDGQRDYQMQIQDRLFNYWAKHGPTMDQDTMKLLGLNGSGEDRDLVWDTLQEYYGDEELNNIIQDSLEGLHDSWQYEYIVTSFTIEDVGDITIDVLVNGDTLIPMVQESGGVIEMSLWDINEKSAEDKYEEVYDEVRNTISNDIEEVLLKDLPVDMNLDYLDISEPGSFEDYVKFNKMEIDDLREKRERNVLDEDTNEPISHNTMITRKFSPDLKVGDEIIVLSLDSDLHHKGSLRSPQLYEPYSVIEIKQSNQTQLPYYELAGVEWKKMMDEPLEWGGGTYKRLYSTDSWLPSKGFKREENITKPKESKLNRELMVGDEILVVSSEGIHDFGEPELYKPYSVVGIKYPNVPGASMKSEYPVYQIEPIGMTDEDKQQSAMLAGGGRAKPMYIFSPNSSHRGKDQWILRPGFRRGELNEHENKEPGLSPELTYGDTILVVDVDKEREHGKSMYTTPNFEMRPERYVPYTVVNKSMGRGKIIDGMENYYTLILADKYQDYLSGDYMVDKDSAKLLYPWIYQWIPADTPTASKVDRLTLIEHGADTSWSDDDDKVTLQEILELTKDIPIIPYPTKELAKIPSVKKLVLGWEDNNPEEIERISQVEVSRQYPILVMVNEYNEVQWVLDGNHRTQKALMNGIETIPAKLIKPSDLDERSIKIFYPDGIPDKENLNKLGESLNEQTDSKLNPDLMIGDEIVVVSTEGIHDFGAPNLFKPYVVVGIKHGTTINREIHKWTHGEEDEENRWERERWERREWNGKEFDTIPYTYYQIEPIGMTDEERTGAMLAGGGRIKPMYIFPSPSEYRGSDQWIFRPGFRRGERVEDYFTGSKFGDDEGNEFDVENIYEYVKSNGDKYLKKNISIEGKLKHNFKWWEDKYDINNPEHKERMMNSDTSFPILVVIEKDGNWAVSDGLNRLYKAKHVEGKDTIDGYVISKEEIVDQHIGQLNEQTNPTNTDLFNRFLKDFWPKHRSQLYSDLYNTYHPSNYVESFTRPSMNFEYALETVADAVHDGKKLGLIDSSVHWSDIYDYEARDSAALQQNVDSEDFLHPGIDDDGIPTLNNQLEIMDNTNLDWIHGILLFDVLEEIVDEFKHYCGENGIDESGTGKCMHEFPPSADPTTFTPSRGTLKQDYYTLFNFMRELERAGIPVTDYLKDPTYPNIIKLVDTGDSDYNEVGGPRESEDWENMRTQTEFEMDAPDRIYEQEEPGLNPELTYGDTILIVDVDRERESGETMYSSTSKELRPEKYTPYTVVDKESNGHKSTWRWRYTLVPEDKLDEYEESLDSGYGDYENYEKLLYPWIYQWIFANTPTASKVDRLTLTEHNQPELNQRVTMGDVIRVIDVDKESTYEQPTYDYDTGNASGNSLMTNHRREQVHGEDTYPRPMKLYMVMSKSTYRPKDRDYLNPYWMIWPVDDDGKVQSIKDLHQPILTEKDTWMTVKKHHSNIPGDIEAKQKEYDDSGRNIMSRRLDEHKESRLNPNLEPGDIIRVIEIDGDHSNMPDKWEVYKVHDVMGLGGSQEPYYQLAGETSEVVPDTTFSSTRLTNAKYLYHGDTWIYAEVDRKTISEQDDSNLDTYNWSQLSLRKSGRDNWQDDETLSKNTHDDTKLNVPPEKLIKYLDGNHREKLIKELTPTLECIAYNCYEGWKNDSDNLNPDNTMEVAQQYCNECGDELNNTLEKLDQDLVKLGFVREPNGVWNVDTYTRKTWLEKPFPHTYTVWIDGLVKEINPRFYVDSKEDVSYIEDSRLEKLNEDDGHIDDMVYRSEPREKHTRRMAKDLGSLTGFPVDKFKNIKPPNNESETTEEEIEYLSSIPVDNDFIESAEEVGEHFKKFLEPKGLEYPKKEIKSVISGVKSIVLQLKYHYNRPRPWQVANAREFCFDCGYEDLTSTPSYPSGHATEGRFVARYLADLYPEYEEELRQIGDDIAYSRNMAKVHYPSDSEFGKLLGDSMYEYVYQPQEELALSEHRPVWKTHNHSKINYVVPSEGLHESIIQRVVSKRVRCEETEIGVIP